ncbi:MAG TPA: LacI family DNA-binding transcriptional regulator [Propionibacteriaceae bacterium]
MTVTRADVARKAGVSSAVVSYVVNNGPRPVSLETRARVQKAILELGYRPNAIASALRGGATRSIGFLTPNPRNAYHAQLAEAVERAFLAEGYLVLTGNTYYDRTREERLLKTFLDRKVDGLLLASGSTVTTPLPPELSDVPVVLLDDIPAAGAGVTSVSWDGAADAAKAVDHLQGHGHRLIAHIAGPPHLRGEESKTRGWQQQQLSRQHPAGDELVAFADLSEEGGSSAAALLLGARGRPTTLHEQRPSAVFVSSDVQGIGAISACYQLGLHIPGDVAVISLGGTKAASFAHPPLTTVRHDFDHLAEITAGRLLALIKDPGRVIPSLQERGNLVVGESCGCPRPSR